MKKFFFFFFSAAMVMMMGVCAMAENTITEDTAKQIALEKAGMTADQVRFTKAHLDNDNGRLEWEIEFVADGMEYEFDIDAQTGNVFDTDIDLAD